MKKDTQRFAPSVKELAKVLNVSQATIKELERDERSPKRLPGGSYNVRRWFTFLDNYDSEDVETAIRSWDKMQNESDKWWARFRYFSRLPPGERSIERVFREMLQKPGKRKGKARPQIHWFQAAKEWRWKERAKDYDAYMQRKEEDIMIEERRRVISEILQSSQERRSIGMQALRKRPIYKMDGFLANQLVLTANRDDMNALGLDNKNNNGSNGKDVPAIRGIILMPEME